MNLYVPIFASFVWHVQSYDGFLNHKFCLRVLLVSGRFVSEGLDELVSEYLDVGPTGSVSLVIRFVCLLHY